MVWCGCHEFLLQRSVNVLFLSRFCHLPLQSLCRPLYRKSKYSFTKCQSFWEIEVNNTFFNDLAFSSLYLLRLFAVLSIHLFISVSRFRSFTMPAASLSVLYQTQLKKVFSLYAGALTLTLITSQGYMAGCGCHDILIQRRISVLFWSNFSLYPTQL